MMLRAVSRVAASAATKQTASKALPAFSSPLISMLDDDDGKRRREKALSLLPSQHRSLHTTAQAESTVLVVGLGVATVATAAVYGLKVYEKYAAAKADAQPPAEGQEGESSSEPLVEAAKDKASEASKEDAKGSDAKADAGKEAPKAASGGGGMFGAQAFAKRFYKGGFEDKMTRREAALILGVRESADPSRIRDRHRKMLMNNHPDTGGSTFIATKINEAKDVLIKGKASS